MCIVQASSVSKTSSTDHHNFIVSVLSKWFILQHLLVSLSPIVWIIFRLSFKTFFWRYLYFSLSLNKYAPLFQACCLVFARICLRTSSIVLAGCLSLFLTFAVFMKLSLMIVCIHSIEIGCKKSRYGLEISRKHPRLVFAFSIETKRQTLLLYLHVFSLLVRLTWFC